MVCLFCNMMKLVLKYLIKVSFGARKKDWSKKILAILGKGSPAKSCSPAISWNFLRVGRMSEVWGQESWCQELVALDHRVDLSIPTMARSRLGRGDLSFSEWTDWEQGWLRMFCFRVWDGEPGWLRWIFGAPEQWQGGCSDYRRDFELRYSYWLKLWWFFLFMLKIFDHHLLWHRLWSWFWAWATRMAWRERKGGQGWSREWSRP